MPREDDDTAMRAELALLQLEQADVDDRGEIVDKPYEAHRLRMAGLNYQQIAKRLGYTTQQAAHRAVTMYLQSAAVRLSDQRKEEALNLNLSRLETLMHQHWNPALLGDVQSANVVLKCISELNKIMGLYENTDAKVTERFVVIRNDGNYAQQLQKIALNASDPKQLGTNQSENGDVDDER